MFRRILCAAQVNNIDLNEILSYELTLVPMSLFHEDGSMRKTLKSDLTKKIENDSNVQINIPIVQSLIIDGMVILQQLNENQFDTFNNLGKTFFKKVLCLGRSCQATRITLVFDTYRTNSIKAAERVRRGEINKTNFDIKGSRKVHKFREFLKSITNKQNLLKFLTKYMTENKDLLQNDESLIIAGGFEETSERVAMFSREGTTQPLPELYSNHEEADTRIILHLIFESKFSEQILVKSVDTDVLILLIHYFNSIPDLKKNQIYVQLGHGPKSRCVNINIAVDNLGQKICSCLLAIHCLTGCDTTSAFYKIGKKKQHLTF